MNSIAAECAESTPGPDRDGEAVPLFQRQVSDAELAAFAEVGTRIEAAAQQLLFRRGENGDCMYVIEAGRINLSFDGDIADKVLGARDFFGELALFIGQHTRMASIEALEPCTMLKVRRDDFDRLLQRQPLLMADFMRRSFTYLVASEQQLVVGLKRRNEDLLRIMSSLHQTRSQLSLAQGQVRTDELTGLCNRRGLYVYLEELPADSGTRHLGLLLIDLDQFKQVNDHRGHLVGDEVLCAVGRTVQALTRPGDLLCRLGGDEFALLTHVPDPGDLGRRAEHIVRAIRDLRFTGQRDELRISVSIGGGLCHPQANWSAWYSEIDRALYHVKGSGGDHWHILHGVPVPAS